MNSGFEAFTVLNGRPFRPQQILIQSDPRGIWVFTLFLGYPNVKCRPSVGHFKPLSNSLPQAILKLHRPISLDYKACHGHLVCIMDYLMNW